MDTAVVSTSTVRDDLGRQCWVCFATDADEPSLPWVRPCRCRGSTKWVHHNCIQRWFDEKQKGDPGVRVFCPQCNTEYSFVYPPMSLSMLIIDVCERVANKLSPVLAGGVVCVSLVWVAASMGGVTVLQVAGPERGWDILTQTDPLILFFALPIMPCVLVLGKMIRWDDYLLSAWRRFKPRLGKLLGVGSDDERAPLREPGGVDTQLNFAATTRLFCGAMLLPTIATLCGNYLFARTQPPLKRTLMGGLAYVAVKGIVQMYYKQTQYTRLASRMVEDFNEPTSL